MYSYEQRVNAVELFLFGLRSATAYFCCKFLLNLRHFVIIMRT